MKATIEVLNSNDNLKCIDLLRDRYLCPELSGEFDRETDDPEYLDTIEYDGKMHIVECESVVNPNSNILELNYYIIVCVLTQAEQAQLDREYNEIERRKRAEAAGLLY